MRKCISAVLVLMCLPIALCLICCMRTAYLTFTRPPPPTPCTVDEAEGYIGGDKPWERFKGALKIPSVSTSAHKYDRTELRKLNHFIRQNYPTIFKSPLVRPDVINEYSLLLSVEGQNKSLEPYALTGHLDVVPVIQEEWEFPGFAAQESPDGSMVYARGAFDNKAGVVGILEALNFLLGKGVKPQRGFFVAFGHDEEVGGEDGAAMIAEELRRRGVTKLAFILDEGLPITTNLLPGLAKDVAPIGVTEKGSLFLNLTVHSEGGHSSAPPPQSSIGILANAIARLEQNPHNLIMDKLTENFIASLSLDMSFPQSIACSNMWLFKPIVGRAIAKGKTQGLVRTTTAVTMIGGGIKNNVIPPSAWAIVNHRIHPTQTIEEVNLSAACDTGKNRSMVGVGTLVISRKLHKLSYANVVILLKIIAQDKKIINDDRVHVELLKGYEAHPVSPHNPEEDVPFKIISDSVRQVYPNVVPSPMTMVANTDMGYYLNFTKSIYRFTPIVMDGSDLYRIHGRDERANRKSFEAAMNFYYHLMLNVDAVAFDKKPQTPHGEL